MATEQKNTIKFSTILYLILGLIVPLWPISLPLFWYFAYRSYKSGAAVDLGQVSSISDLKQAQELFEAGVISAEELAEVKRGYFGAESKAQADV